MQHVDIKIHGSVATILLSRADTHNALSPQLLEDLQQAFSDIHQEKRVRSVILTASGDHFCSGVDLKTLSQINDLPEMQSLPELHGYWQRLTGTLEQMLRFPKPIIAAVDGAAIGAGFALVLAADMTIATTQARFAADAPRRGLVGGATAALLNFRLGGAQAARLLLTGRSIDAAEAFRIGLCNPPVSSDQIWVTASQLAAACTEFPAEAVQATKRILNESVGEALMTQLVAGAADSATACTTEAASEGIEAFLQRREPQWP